MPPLLVSWAFVFSFLSVVYCYYQVIIFWRAEQDMGREKKVNEERNRRASILLINPLKINTTVPGSMYRNALGIG